MWLFLHSGSRGVGNKIAMHHITVAQKQCASRYITLPDPDLAYLVEGDDEFWSYIRELGWAQTFALLNREEMMDRVVACFEAWVGSAVRGVGADQLPPQLHRPRRSTSARTCGSPARAPSTPAKGPPASSPDSMGTRSYVVVGKGNRLALNSSPARGGARVRAPARPADLHLRAARRRRWRASSGPGRDEFIDEIPNAYKDIDVVMQDAAGPGRGAAHAAPDRQRQGRLTTPPPRAPAHQTVSGGTGGDGGASTWTFRASCATHFWGR